MPADAYGRIIARIFATHHREAATAFTFRRAEIAEAAEALGLPPPSNVGDVVYTFRSRKPLPDEIADTAPEGKEWVIRAAGGSQYEFALVSRGVFTPNESLMDILIPDGTPALVDLYRQSDEQALLAIIRYNRLVDIFTKLSCFSIQSHLRTTLHDVGQVEIDELYIGIDRGGTHYVVPIEVKSATDRLGLGQIENMFTLCEQKFPVPIPRPLGAQFVNDDCIAMFEFARNPTDGEIKIASERRYRLMPADQLPPDVLAKYRHAAE